jgi:hypothetical protein
MPFVTCELICSIRDITARSIKVSNIKQSFLNLSINEICRSGFATFPPELLQEQPVVVLLLEGDFVSWSLAMDEHNGLEDLRGSGRRSVIPYVRGRIELYCSNLYEPEPFLFSTPL